MGFAPVPAPGDRERQRRAARELGAVLLRAAGASHTRIGHRPDGAPVFPDGLAGSLAHAPRIAAAALAEGVPGVGVDVESARVEPRLARIVLDDRERATLWQHADGARLRMLFCAKEAGFKALSECREAHGGLYWRVRLSRGGGRLWASAGDERALLLTGRIRAATWALAVREPSPGAWRGCAPVGAPQRISSSGNDCYRIYSLDFSPCVA